jgi:uncharacterized membrane protein YidH (DUF202 family)
MFSEDLTIKEMFYQVLCAGAVVTCIGISLRMLGKKEKYRQIIDRFFDKLLKLTAIILMVSIVFYFIAIIAKFLYVMIVGPLPPQ